MAHVAALFTSIDFWRLRPAPDALAEQPGRESAARAVTVAASDNRDLLVAYTPASGTIALNTSTVPSNRATWHDPRTGARTRAAGTREGPVTRFQTPGDGDWVLVVSRR